MRRSNRDTDSTATERCDGCERDIDQVYLDAGTSVDVHLHTDAASGGLTSREAYHFCGNCGVEVATLLDEHFGPDGENDQLSESHPVCDFCSDPIDATPLRFAFQPHGTGSWGTNWLCHSCVPIVRQFCEQIPETEPEGDEYAPPEPPDEPFTDARNAVFRYAKPYNQLTAGDRFVLEARQRATPDFPEQRLKIAAAIADRGREPKDSFEAPLSEIQAIGGNWIGIQPTNGVLELDYGTGTRQLRIRFDDAVAPDNRHRSFEGYVTHVAPLSAEPGRHHTSS